MGVFTGFKGLVWCSSVPQAQACLTF